MRLWLGLGILLCLAGCQSLPESSEVAGQGYLAVPFEYSSEVSFGGAFNGQFLLVESETGEEHLINFSTNREGKRIVLSDALNSGEYVLQGYGLVESSNSDTRAIGRRAKLKPTYQSIQIEAGVVLLWDQLFRIATFKGKSDYHASTAHALDPLSSSEEPEFREMLINMEGIESWSIKP